MGTSGSVRAYDSKVVSAGYSFPFAGTVQGFSPLTLAPNGLLYAVSASRTQTAAPIQNTVVLVVDPGKSNGRNLATGELESWSAAQAYLVHDNYPGRPTFGQILLINSETQYTSKGILAPNGLLYHTQSNGYGPSSGIPGILIINPGTGLVACTGAQGTIAGTTLTITIAPSSGSFGIGQTITGAGIPDNTTITAFLTGRGGSGTYTISTSLTIGTAISITGSPFPDCTWEFDATFQDTRAGRNKFNGGVLAPDNWIYLTPSRTYGTGASGGSSITRRIAPRSVAGGWTNPNNASTTTDLHETGFYNAGGLSNKNLAYFNVTSSLSSKYFYPIDASGSPVVGPGIPAKNTTLVTTANTDIGAFGSSFYHPNGKIYYVGGAAGVGTGATTNSFIFYHDTNANTWNTVTELVSKASLFLPATLTNQNTFLSAQFEKPLDTVETTVNVFQIVDLTTIMIYLNKSNGNAAKFFEGMLIESTDNIFNGTTYVYSRTISGTNVIITIKNEENTTPYNILNEPTQGSNIKAKQDPQKLKVYLFRIFSTLTTVSTPTQTFGIYLFDPVTESVSLVSGTSNISGSNANNYAYPIVLPNGRFLRTASNAISNNIFTGTDSKLLVTPNRQNTILPTNGIPGLNNIPNKSNIPNIQAATFSMATSIPIAGNSVGKTYASVAGVAGTAGELVSIKGYGPGIRFFNVTEEDLSYYTIPKTPTGEFDADNFATSYYNYFFNRPC
jgi:hypothetical protein